MFSLSVSRRLFVGYNAFFFSFIFYHILSTFQVLMLYSKLRGNQDSPRPSVCCKLRMNYLHTSSEATASTPHPSRPFVVKVRALRLCVYTGSRVVDGVAAGEVLEAADRKRTGR